MDAVAADKQAARRRFRRLRLIGSLFRCAEALVAAALLLSWSSSHLSFDLLGRLAAGLLGPRFIFLLANAIVLLLLAESGRLSLSPASAAAASDGGGSALYEEFLDIRRRFSESLPPQEEVVFEDKAVCVETRALRRTRSEKASAKRRRAKPELQRAETDVGRKGKAPPAPGEESDQDAEEFRRTIDEFIAKHTMFRAEEVMKAVVVSASCEATSCALICSAGTPEPYISK
ncbi:hypothetical protein Cni_G25815 [Canna indica]|uniref:Uncharacterized protein n=1 Tax=Canna indica TaxID=4628 RepID=A0AAQ3QPT1_9LILI|nr:hypothetical protein Cni_G25815 [Canna indica]